MQKEFKGTTPRPPRWDKSTFLDDLKEYRSIKDVCQAHVNELELSSGEKTITWRGLYNDVWRWRKEDSLFDEKVASMSLQKSGGRPPKDGGDESWQDDFCETFYNTSGDIGKAAEVTPYSIRQLMEFLDQGSTSYRKDFHDRFMEVKLRIVGELQSLFLSQRLDKAYETESSANIAQRKAWISLKGLEKLYPTLWGRKSELNVQGRIDHVHGTQRALPPEERLSLLWAERQEFFERRKTEALQLVEGQTIKREELSVKEKEEIVDAEVIEGEPEVAEV